MSLFKLRNNSDTADSLAAYLPNDRLFSAKKIEGTNLRSFLKGLSWEFMKTQALLSELPDEYLPDTTTKLISEWESMLGIPDECFKANGDVNERRRDILIKLASLGAQTGADFEEIAGLFGLSASVTPGLDSGEVFGGGDTEARFTIVVDVMAEVVDGFPYSYPLPFVSTSTALMECVLNKIKPANCNVLVREAP